MQLRRYTKLKRRSLSDSLRHNTSVCKDKQAHKDVMQQLLNKRDLFEDPEDTVTRQDLDDKLVNWLYAEVDNLRSELIELFVALWFIIGTMRFLFSK